MVGEQAEVVVAPCVGLSVGRGGQPVGRIAHWWQQVQAVVAFECETDGEKLALGADSSVAEECRHVLACHAGWRYAEQAEQVPPLVMQAAGMQGEVDRAQQRAQAVVVWQVDVLRQFDAAMLPFAP